MLYIIATPIGNLSEITFRAVEVLKNVDYILCEDTRTSSVLLNHYQVSKPLVSYHKFNETEKLDKIIIDLKSGFDIALISDAGMPCVSDPGSILVNACIENGIEYTVISGASALINAFVLSGMSAPFTFVGFLPNKNSEKREMLKDIKDYKNTLIFYMSPYDIKKELSELLEILGDRKIAVVREISKSFEEVVHSTLSQNYNGTIKGEFVVVVDGKPDEENPLNALSVDEHLDFYINLGYKKRDAIEMVSTDRKVKKNEIYKIAHTEK